MKLLVCKYCNDIFNLTLDEKTCSCGKTAGHYLPDKINIEISKEAVVFGINNSSFSQAFFSTDFSSSRGKEFLSFFITDDCGRILRRGE